ncbi:hypothetical protein LTR48_001151 [Friedmanniomyces endolithicus]|uniref:Uncharacterized protein n=1 Tax=Rachicladosporium monterosium TaxID=1507873 RepID=A0ABR0L7J8_9PEZI|nr:hypothetical protein LTR29_008743 [Friedmanniomyces endolithicus]KAK1088862.1 hypothetical protein LTR48_001151 [Friedmanniomyces endolithicus]KAK1814525.1 hypothetical protein LTR12_011079 [Friedmanniomyces endolithicus]KAK5144161.1 hypothetical protein LTR32_003852 [Rachicladosporium monterosium]
MLQSRFTRSRLLNQVLATTTLLAFIYFSLNNLLPAIRYNVVPHRHPILLDNAQSKARPGNNTSSPTVHLVIASTKADDTSWTSRLTIPNLTILRYISDDPSAPFHPPKPKGHEALIYFTYLHDFYDSLPDLTLFIHASETPWHVEGTLLRNTTFALSQLNLHKVLQQRHYFNLRVTWRAGCPAWIDTTKTHSDFDEAEEPFMAEAWRANFGVDEPVPDTLGGPCCSQFAVTREAIRRRPREQYRFSRDWIVDSTWSDAILGRVCEHMWPRLFTDEASDCGYAERGSLCQMYGVCFESEGELEGYKELWEERERLKERMSFLRAVWDAKKAAGAKGRFGEVNDEIERQLSVAWRRGHA